MGAISQWNEEVMLFLDVHTDTGIFDCGPQLAADLFVTDDDLDRAVSLVVLDSVLAEIVQDLTV